MEVKVFILILLKISFSECKMEPFIVGGEFVKSISEFPYVAALALDTPEGEFICGSTILNQIILVTAAHCLDDGVTSGVATVGNVNRMKGSGHTIYSFVQHKQWDSEHIRNDIALCKMKIPIQFSTTVQKALLLKNPPQTEKAEVAGWGAIEESQFTDTDVLKHTIQRVWTHNMCKTVLANILASGTICGGERHAHTNIASKGDSGSGLVANNNIIIGLVSFKNFKVSRSLVVYTDVAYFYEWIQKQAEKLTSKKL